MKIEITGDAKEIAALVLELQRQRGDQEMDHQDFDEEVRNWLFPPDHEYEKEKRRSYPVLSHDYPLLAHVLLHVGEMLLAIALADFFLSTLPKFIQVLMANCGIWF